MSSLRVASLDLRGLRSGPAAAAVVVRAIDPDVLLLQGLPRYPGSSYALSALAREAGLLWSGRARPASSTAVMSALRVNSSDAEDRKLSARLHEGPRTYSVVRVQVPDGPTVALASVHLSSSAGRRVRQARAVLSGIADGSSDPEGGPLVVGGVLNEGSEGSAWNVLAASAVTAATATTTASLSLVSDARSAALPAQRHRSDLIFARGQVEAVPGDPHSVEGALVRDAGFAQPVWVDLTYPNL